LLRQRQIFGKDFRGVWAQEWEEKDKSSQQQGAFDRTSWGPTDPPANIFTVNNLRSNVT